MSSDFDFELEQVVTTDKSVAGLQKRRAAAEALAARVSDDTDDELSLTTVSEGIAKAEQALDDADDERVELIKAGIEFLREESELAFGMDPGDVSPDIDFDTLDQESNSVSSERVAMATALLEGELERVYAEVDQFAQKLELSTEIQRHATRTLEAYAEHDVTLLLEGDSYSTLIRAVRECSDEAVRLHAITAITKVVSERSGVVDDRLVTLATGCCESSQPQARYHAVRLLRFIAEAESKLVDETVADALISTLSDSEQRIRRLAAYAVAETAVTAADVFGADEIAVIRQRFQTADQPTERAALVNALGGIIRGGPADRSLRHDALQVLNSALDAEPAVQRSAMYELIVADALSEAMISDLTEADFIDLLSEQPSDMFFTDDLSENIDTLVWENTDFAGRCIIPAILHVSIEGTREAKVEAAEWAGSIISAMDDQIWPDLLEALYRLLISDDETVQKATLEALQDIVTTLSPKGIYLVVIHEVDPSAAISPDVDTIHTVLMMLLDHENESIRTTAAELFGIGYGASYHFEDEEVTTAVTTIEQLFADGDLLLEAAPKAIGHIVAELPAIREQLLAPIIDGLAADDSETRYGALRVFATTIDKDPSVLTPENVNRVLTLQDADQRTVRVGVGTVVAFIIRERPHLLDDAVVVERLLTDDDPVVQVGLIRVFAEIVSESPPAIEERILSALQTALNSPNDQARSAAVNALNTIASTDESKLDGSIITSITDQLGMGRSSDDAMMLETIQIAAEEQPAILDEKVVEVATERLDGTKHDALCAAKLLATTAATRPRLISKSTVDALGDTLPRSNDSVFTSTSTPSFAELYALDAIEEVVIHRPDLLNAHHVGQLLGVAAMEHETARFRAAELLTKIAERRADLLTEDAVSVLQQPLTIDALTAAPTVTHRAGEALKTIAEHRPSLVLSISDDLLRAKTPAGAMAVADALATSGNKQQIDPTVLEDVITDREIPPRAVTVFLDTLATHPSQTSSSADN